MNAGTVEELPDGRCAVVHTLNASLGVRLDLWNVVSVPAL
jgi:hypothetical protein